MSAARSSWAPLTWSRTRATCQTRTKSVAPGPRAAARRFLFVGPFVTRPSPATTPTRRPSMRRPADVVAAACMMRSTSLMTPSARCSADWFPSWCILMWPSRAARYLRARSRARVGSMT